MRLDDGRPVFPPMSPTADVTDFPIVQVASECDLYGHDYHVTEDRLEPVQDQPIGRRPWKVFCPRCGMSWKVER